MVTVIFVYREGIINMQRISAQIIWADVNGKQRPGVLVMGKYHKHRKVVSIGIYPFVWIRNYLDPVVPTFKLYAEKKLYECPNNYMIKDIVNTYIKEKNVEVLYKDGEYTLFVNEDTSMFGNTRVYAATIISRSGELCQIRKPTTYNHEWLYIINPENKRYVYTRPNIYAVFLRKYRIGTINLNFNDYGRPWK